MDFFTNNIADIAVWAVIVVVAALGYRQGFMVAVATLAGIVGGTLIGTRVGPLVFAAGPESPYTPLAGLIGAMVVGLALGIGLQGLAGAARRRIDGKAVHAIDGFGGALLGATLGVVMVWIVGAMLLVLPGTAQWRDELLDSNTLARVNQLMPPSGPVLNSLAALDPLPLFDGPAAKVELPPKGIARLGPIRRAADSVGRVVGQACGINLTGSAWVVGRNLMVTNAHVVAGVHNPRVEMHDSDERLNADVVAFDPVNDVAVLRVKGLNARPLAFAREVPAGAAGAALGFPEGGPYTATSARIDSTKGVRTSDIYGLGDARGEPFRRKIVIYRANVRPGNSGGPVVDTSGRVLATVFGGAMSGDRSSAYGVPNDVVKSTVAGAHSSPVTTGRCA